MNKKRVFCFILPSFFFERKGGAEIQCYYIAQVLINIGYEVHYIRETDKPFLKETVYDGIILHSVFNNKLLKRFPYLQYLIRTVYLQKIVKKVHADYWYIRSNDTYLPFINKLRNKENSELIWACAHDFKVQKDFWKKRFGFAIQNKILKSLTDAKIVFQTKYQQKTFKHNYEIGGDVIYNSHPVPEYPIKKEQTIVWLSNLKSLKRPELFLELVAKMKNSPYYFFMIGKDYRNQYSELIKETENGCYNFRYLGELETEEVYKIFKKAKLLINTSEAEGFSNTFIEAWLRGIPVLSLKVDPDDLIQKENLGVICPELDSLEENICKFMENSSGYKMLSRHVYEYAVEHFDINKNTTTLLDYIEKK